MPRKHEDAKGVVPKDSQVQRLCALVAKAWWIEKKTEPSQA